MKTQKKKKFKRLSTAGLALIMIAGFSISSMIGCCQVEDKDVSQAYDLRMQGKVDQALDLINLILSDDSTNALAHFEKFRILNYMMIGGADVSIDDVLASIEKAVSYDIDNLDFAFSKATASFLKAYIFMQHGDGNTVEAVMTIRDAFKHVLTLDPDHPQSMLYLVDINSQLPAEMGGDHDEALIYAEMLKNTNDYYAAKADLLLYPRDELTFWQEYLDTHEKTPEVYIELGTASLYNETPDMASQYYDEAIKLDPSYNIYLLNPARYYMFLVMQGQAEADSELPKAAKYINLYLDSEPAPQVPMKAFATGMLVKTKMFTGQKEEGKELMEKAKLMDPYFSKAFAIPDQSLFDPLDKLKSRYSSFFKPF